MDHLDEGRFRVKRHYGEHKHIRVNEKGAPVRDTVVKFIGKNYVTEEDLHNHLIRLEEDRGGKQVDKGKFFQRNKKLFITFEKKGQTYYSLSKYGMRVLEMIKNRDKKPMVNESNFRNIPSMSEFIAVNEAKDPTIMTTSQVAEMQEMLGEMSDMVKAVAENDASENGPVEMYEMCHEMYEMMKEMYG